MPELPTGTVTFLFTDVEGSTRLWEEYPDAMRAAAARHDEILRDAVESNHGCVVKTTGDGVHAAFGTAHDGVDAAVAAQLAIEGEQWGASGRLRVRMGLHTCEAEVRDADYYGSGVNRAARLMSAAHGGQIVVSLATSELVRETDVELLDLGEQRLRDLMRVERVFQVCAPGLVRDFPPLRSLDALPGNLPRQVTSFIGRGPELAKIGEAFEYAPVVTLTGVGGVGKTRLAVHAAADLALRFPEGVWLCELAAADSADVMVQLVASTLGVVQRSPLSLVDSIVEFLGSRRIFVVLDNCEHVLDAASDLAARVVRGCENVRILATSREALDVDGERVMRVRSLALPPETDDLAALVECDAVRLFVERADAAASGFELTPANGAAVGEICRRLDGIPLAIELAAARVVAMRPPEIAALLDERFRLLTGGRRTSVERHQTLRATVEWSYSLLAPTERLVFERLAVFAGSFDARAATAVVSGDAIEPWDVIDALASLVAKSMLVDDEAADGTTRYSFLETLRQYAREQLDQTGPVDTWRRRHAEHYAALAEELGVTLAGPDELIAVEHVVDEWDNIRAAVRWSVDSVGDGDEQFAMRVIKGLGVIAGRGTVIYFEDWWRLAQCAEKSPPARRAAVLATLSTLWVMGNGDLETARRLAVAALRDAGSIKEPQAAVAYSTLAVIEFRAERFDQAVRLNEEGLRLLDAMNDASHVRAGMLLGRAAFLSRVGNRTASRAAAEEVLQLAQKLRHPGSLAGAYWGVGLALEVDGDATGALRAFEESAALTRKGAIDSNFGGTLSHIARLREHGGDIVGALEALHEGITHFQYLDRRGETFTLLAATSRLYARLGEPEPAAILAGALLDGPLASLGGSGFSQRLSTALAPARTQLGDNDFTHATTRGAAMTADQVTTYARAALEQTLAAATD